MRSHVYQIYTDASGQFRWRLKSKNGKIIADSAESYTRKDAIKVAIKKLTSITSFKVVG
jgi:hypothetical protein